MLNLQGLRPASTATTTHISTAASKAPVAGLATPGIAGAPTFSAVRTATAGDGVLLSDRSGPYI